MEKELTVENEYRSREVKKTIFQLVKFVIVGLTNTAITMAAIFILWELFKVNRYAANGIGYLLGFLNSFLLNKLWTFKSKNPPLREFLFFLLIFAISYLIQLGSLYCLEIVGLNARVATVLGMGVYTCVNFVGNRLFTFKGRSKTAI